MNYIYEAIKKQVKEEILKKLKISVNPTACERGIYLELIFDGEVIDCGYAMLLDESTKTKSLGGTLKQGWVNNYG